MKERKNEESWRTADFEIVFFCWSTLKEAVQGKLDGKQQHGADQQQHGLFILQLRKRPSCSIGQARIDAQEASKLDRVCQDRVCAGLKLKHEKGTWNRIAISFSSFHFIYFIDPFIYWIERSSTTR